MNNDRPMACRVGLHDYRYEKPVDSKYSLLDKRTIRVRMYRIVCVRCGKEKR